MQSKIASLPTPADGGDYSADIEALQADIDGIYTELDDLRVELQDVLAEVDDMLADWEEQQDTNSNDDSIDFVDATTRWSLDVWTDYDSFKLLEAEVDSNKRIEDEDDYTIWLQLYNNNYTPIDRRDTIANRPSADLTVGYLYYATDTKELWKAISTTSWEKVTNLASIYQVVEVKEVIVQFSPKSSDRVIVDESQTELYSSGYPSFDWDMDYSNRSDGSCKRIEATTDVRLALQIPTKFEDNDPERPYPEEFKLEFELAYKA